MYHCTSTCAKLHPCQDHIFNYVIVIFSRTRENVYLLLPCSYKNINYKKLTVPSSISSWKKGVPSAVGFPHCAGSGEGLFLNPKPYPHKCAEAGARTQNLPITDGRLYRCTRPALLQDCQNGLPNGQRS